MQAKFLSQRSLAVVLTTILLLVAVPVVSVFAASSGPNYPGTVATGGGTGDAWTASSGTLAAALGADGGATATIAITSSANGAQNLNMTKLGFSIPTSATITGISVEINRWATDPNSIQESQVQLLQGTAVGNNKASGTAWSTTTSTVVTYGNSTDLWGATWTPAQVNNSNFGVTLDINKIANGTRNADVDYVRITVTYKDTPTLSVTNSPVTYDGTSKSATVVGSVPGAVSNVKYNGSSTAPTNAGTYAITADFVPTDTTNYSSLVDASAGNFVIDKATPTASITNSPVIYNGSIQTATVVCLGGGTATLASGGTGTNAGSYPATVDCAASTNYNAANGLAAGNFVINKATPTASITNSPVVYDGSVQTATVACSGGGTATLASGGTGTNAGSYPATVDCAASTNYNAAAGLAAGSFVINKGAPTASITNSPVTYNGSVQTATVACLGGGTATLASGGTGTDVGSYPATVDCAASTNYNAAAGLAAGNFVIDKATPTASITNSPVTYTGSVQTATVACSGGGTATLASGGTGTDAGSYPATVDCAASTNYNAATGLAAGNFVIDQATPTASITNSPVIYNGSAQTATVACLGGGTATLASGGTGTDVGSYPATVDCAASTNYGAANGLAAGSFVIDPANQTITFGTLADKFVGDADFAVNATASSGLAVSFSSTTTGVCTVTVDGTVTHIVSAGICTIQAGQAGNTNYNAAAPVDQSFTVHPAGSIIVTISGVTADNKVYDGTPTATLNTGSAALVGVASGDDVQLDSTSAAGTFANKNIGTGKTVTTSGFALSGANAGKYSLTQPTATADITSKDLTVSAAGVNKVYDGTSAATVTLSSNAFVGDIVTLGSTSAVFADAIAGNGKAVTVSGISISGADAGNYNLLNTTANTTANITLAPLTVTADNHSKSVGQPDPAFTFSYSGFVNGETSVVINTLPTCGVSGPHTGAGAYPIVCSGGSDDNYGFSYVNGTLTINAVATQTFEDVPPTHPFWRFIEGFYAAGITSGCSTSPLRYCPDQPVTRGQMAVFIEKALGNTAPAPSPSDMFTDVSAGNPFKPFIEQFYNSGITSGCSTSPLKYCPDQPVTRGQMAVFLEKALGNNAPAPSPSGMFTDVSAGDPFKPFIEQFYNDGITSGCSTSPLQYCPTQAVTRGQMAVFISKAFGIPLP